MSEETTFRPRLTGCVLGSSSTNWRRTEPAPHLNNPPQPQPAVPQQPQPGQVEISSLMAKLRFQRELELARITEDCARQEEDRARHIANETRMQCRRELNEEAKISTIINAVISKLDADDIFKPNGSNVCCWEDALRLTAFKRFHDKDFFIPKEDSYIDPYYESITRGIIHWSVGIIHLSNFDKTPYIRPIQPDATQTPFTPKAPARSLNDHPSATKNRRSNPQVNNTKQVDTQMINPDLFAEDAVETYVFEGENLSAEPTLDRFDLNKFKV
ncbi:hypothetical protein PTTG_04714 [Puccinia triticina 1-1 BBBD Race 1]|uniref:Uncharacterized protein n=1 Tax=Puccinia triticina (isolate 1-1 / race 1 (BBBD)) TaxID=630390 RepID=A0A0C4EV82_PUCT1|nr:hypothetical protein PTTG_04714 [Puccinia triticina 1-1 BBBD Race 1]